MPRPFYVTFVANVSKNVILDTFDQVKMANITSFPNNRCEFQVQPYQQNI